MQQICKYCDIQNTSLSHNKELNILNAFLCQELYNTLINIVFGPPCTFAVGLLSGLGDLTHFPCSFFWGQVCRPKFSELWKR